MRWIQWLRTDPVDLGIRQTGNVRVHLLSKHWRGHMLSQNDWCLINESIWYLWEKEKLIVRKWMKFDAQKQSLKKDFCYTRNCKLFSFLNYEGKKWKTLLPLCFYLLSVKFENLMFNHYVRFNWMLSNCFSLWLCIRLHVHL